MSVEERMVRATEIPGMKITFQGPIGPDGLGICYEIAVDQTIDSQDLDELLDRVGDARRRQAAIEELPLMEAQLQKNLVLLDKAEHDKAVHVAQMTARTQQASAGRRNPASPTPQDLNALSQYDGKVLQVKEQIEYAKARIPQLRALVQGQARLSVVPEAAD